MLFLYVVGEELVAPVSWSDAGCKSTAEHRGRRPGRVEPAAGRSLYSQVNGLTILDDLQNYEVEDGKIVEIDITLNPSANA